MSRCGNIPVICLICMSGWLQISCLPATGHNARAQDVPPQAQQNSEEAPQGPRQAPQIVDDSIDLSIRSEYSHNDRVFLPILELAFIGDSKVDDRVLLQYSLSGQPIGSVIDCPVTPARPTIGRTRRERWKGNVRCYANPEQVSLPGPGIYDVDLTYKLTAEGTVGKWRRITFEVGEYYGGPALRDLMVNRDRDLYQGWITPGEPRQYSNDECSDIPTLDMVVLVSPGRTRQQPEPKVVVERCYVNGKQVGKDQTIVRDIGGFHATDVKSQEVFEYRQIRILTDFVYMRPDQLPCLKMPDSKSRAELDNFLAIHPGQWDCKITFDGKLARILHFAVDANGQIPLHTEQTGEGALVFADPATRFVDVELVGGFDREAAKQRLGGTAFFGRPWKTPRLRAVTPDAPSNP